MNNEIISTYTEYDENGRIKSRTVTRTPYSEDTHQKLILDELENTYSGDCEDDNDDGWDDEDDEDCAYIVTPKGLAYMAAIENGLADSFDDPRLDAFWEQFRESMVKLHYALEEM